MMYHNKRVPMVFYYRESNDRPTIIIWYTNTTILLNADFVRCASFTGRMKSQNQNSIQLSEKNNTNILYLYDIVYSSSLTLRFQTRLLKELLNTLHMVIYIFVMVLNINSKSYFSKKFYIE